MTWDKQVPGIFGDPDLIFAGHPADEDRAFEWLTDLRKRGIGWRAVEKQLRDYLQSKNAQADHIEQQLRSAEKYMKPWLLD